MRKKRRSFTAQYKVETVLEVLRGEKTAAQICRERELSDDLLSRWKQEFLKRAPEIFETRRTSNEGYNAVSDPEEIERTRISELERMVERLMVEVNGLKTTSEHQPVAARQAQIR